MYDSTERRVNTSFHVKKAVLFETSGYNDVYHRSYMANIGDRDLVTDFAELTRDGTHVDPVSISGIAGRIISPQAQVGGLIDIDYGFAERRLVFMISVEYRDARSRYPKVCILSGYTDFADYSLQGSINPDTRFYVNSITSVNTANAVARPTEINHLITSKNITSHVGYRDRQRGRDTLVTIRPTDVLGDIGLSFEDRTATFNTTNQIGEYRSLKSRRRNGLATRYLSDIFRSVRSVDTTIPTRYSEFESVTALEQAAAKTRESNMSSDPLTKRLRTYQEFISEGYVRWDDLCYEIEGLNDKATLATETRVSRTGSSIGRPSGRDSEKWSGADNATLAATIANQSLSAIMATCLVTYLECEVSNETIDGQATVRLFDVTTFDDMMDASNQADILAGIIVDEMMPLITNNGEMGCSLYIQFDLMTECFMTVSIDGELPVDFVAPTFCDALYSPVVTDSDETLSDMSRTLMGLIDRVVPSGLIGIDGP